MSCSVPAFVFATILPAILGVVHALPQIRADKPAAFYLAGDSTTAVQSTNGGGWGNGFLNTTLKNGAIGKNYGHNGATTVSFREGGDWATVLGAVEDAKADYTPYVTIQFGHNDQKTDKNISLAQYSANLAQFVADVRDAGGEPYNSAGRINENLADQRNATLAVAKETGALAIDLNRASTDYLNAIGQDNAYTYNLNADDRTHLNEAGSVVFGNMVAWLLDESAESGVLRQWTEANATYVQDFKDGVYIEG
ncbi:Lipase GDSL [Macrophomina phaseolina MS6]|uniref:Lipase GDSL n=1 Tax=Macrophomina phaseolina (strain MS6) TaxID=1126212 RepID=K2RLQ3_MACPH|nr:Lipase GDSL [Macrophomina phaseolina MS6]